MIAAAREARVEVRPTAEDDLPALAELFERRFGHPLSIEEWRWKYRRAPAEARSWVAVAGGPAPRSLLAHAGALAFPARLPDGGEAPIWQLTDWMGTVAAGGLRPPLVTLGRRLLADLPRPGDAPWIFGFPSERHLRLGERTFGYRPLPPVRPLAGILDDALAADPGGSGAEPEPIVELGDRAGAGAEASWAACETPGVRRSSAFLDWRYHARPRRYYRFYRLAPAAAGNAPPCADGLAVFAFVGTLARGAELWLPPGAGGEREAGARWRPALRAVARDLRASGLERWELWPPPPACGLGPLLAELGLRASAAPVPMGCRGRSPGGAGRREPGPPCADPRFYYAMGDYDAV